ncbi:beta-defensin 1 [Microcebus murinus]|uniref:beta-defensin 1 n=1 Tax=Microcebus murinus TaxID=30608 RepID=UPI003F6CEB2F
MRTPCLLLVALCLLFSQVAPGDSLVIGHRPDHYNCYKSGGTCLYSSCPIFTKATGTCYLGKGHCCKPK